MTRLTNTYQNQEAVTFVAQNEIFNSGGNGEKPSVFRGNADHTRILDAYFIGITFDSNIFRHVSFAYCTFIDCKFVNTQFYESGFDQCVLTRTIFENICCGSRLTLSNCAMPNTTMTGMVQDRLEFRDCDITGLDVSGVEFITARHNPLICTYSEKSVFIDLQKSVEAHRKIKYPFPIPKIVNPYTKIVDAIQSGNAELDMSNFHRDGYCGTTHCIAGFTTVNAGADGLELERLIGTDRAARLILLESGCTEIPNFYDTDDDVMLGWLKDASKKELSK